VATRYDKTALSYWEPQLGHEFAGDFDAYRAAGARG
jgi:hypothetical protein